MGSLMLLGSLVLAIPAPAPSGKVIKVLPHFLDLDGRHTLSPSLYERDAYQAFLRSHPESRSGIRFDIQWKVTNPVPSPPLKLKVELRGITEGKLPRQRVLEKEVQTKRKYSHWTGIDLTGFDYVDFGEVTAWRVTLWQDQQLLGEQKSFLW